MKAVYSRTFLAVVAEALSLNFSNLGFACPLDDLGPTLEVCRDRILVLDLSKNYEMTGTLDVVSMCENLESLNLYLCYGLTGE